MAFGCPFDGEVSQDQVVAIAREASLRTGRTIAVAPELKHPTYFAGIGLPMEDGFVAELERLGLTGADALHRYRLADAFLGRCLKPSMPMGSENIFV